MLDLSKPIDYYNYMKFFWQNKYLKYKFILKSGADFIVECKKIRIEWNDDSSLKSYSIQEMNLEKDCPFFIGIKDIAAIIEIK